MTTKFLLPVLAIVAVTPALAQYSLSIYESSSSDGSAIYATGEIQYSPGNNCTMCATASHTYLQTVQITSPTGRVTTCSFNNGDAATITVDLQCTATLDINTDYGTYTIADSPEVECSMIGVVLNTTINDPVLVRIANTYTSSTQSYATPYCAQTGACSAGTAATCPISAVYEGSGQVCYPYYFTSSLVIKGSCFAVGLSFPSGGPGPCS